MSGKNLAISNQQFQLAPTAKSLKLILMASVLATTSLLTACGGSSSSQETQPEVEVADKNDDQNAMDGQGNVVLALTDAEEDFVSYTIGVSSILFTRENGDQVEVLADRTEVDFVEYQELTELFSVVSAPVGKYQSITMELDYSEAYILIQDEDGATYEAQAVDSEGTLLTSHTVTFQLAEEQALEVENGRLRHLTLDLDLSASNTIDSYDPAIVTVEPFVIGSVSLDDEREHRVRGTIVSTDTDAQTLTLDVKPMRKKQGEFGEFVIEFDDTTTFEIDGESLELADALTNLSNQGDDFAVLAYGLVSTDEETGETSFVAQQLLGGSSVPWAGKDVFKGMVSKLEEGVSYVSGMVIDTDARGRSHALDVALTTDDTTTFNSRLDMTLNADHLVPGQKLKSLGQYDDSTELASYNVSGESVQIVLSQVLGQITSMDDSGLVTVDVERLNKRPGKVIKKHTNALELESLVADISDAQLLTVEVGDWIKITGLFNPIATAEESGADMQAYAIAKYEVSESDLKYGGNWSRTGTTPAIDLTENTMTVDLTEGRHKLNFRFNPVNMLPEIDSMTFVSAAETGHFSLRQSGQDTLFYDTFAELLTAVSAATEGDTVNSVAAKGTFDSDSNTMTVTDLVVKLN